MTGTRSLALAPDAGGVAANRLRFLTASAPQTGLVRPLILASWRRSHDFAIAADRVNVPFRDDIDADTPLRRSAEPVLRRLVEQLAGQSVSIVLTDATGLVLSRRSGDAQLERHLDAVRLAPGFSYAEQFVGTNGIGTAVEAGSPAEVFGHEHYAEDLEELACAGVPIYDPISRRMVGVVDLTCWRKDAGALLLTLAKSTAEQIQHALLVSAGQREFEVLQAYRQTCRRTNGIVLAVTRDAVMLNDFARAELDPSDQAVLLALASEAGSTVRAGRRHSMTVTLPTGSDARLYCQQVGADDDLAGLVVHVKIDQSGSVSSGASDDRMLLPGLVGDAPLWRRVCRQVEQTMASRTWLLLEGEPGSGKVSLLRAVQVRRQPPGRSTVLDAARATGHPAWLATVRTALAENDTVILQHVDDLDPTTTRGLSALLDETKRDPQRRHVWVAATCSSIGDDGEQARLTRFFPTTLSVPPLRLRIDDLPAMVTFFLGKLGGGGHVTLSPEALRVLMRSSWPGNVRQLQRLVHDVLRYRRAGVIGVEDLPPGMHSISRRVLSTLESMERDAIVRSLADAGGNKVRAAQALGISRATIYRKIHEFGIVPQS